MNSSAPRKKLISELKRVCEELKKVPREFTSLDLSHCNLKSIDKDMRKRFGEFAKLAELILYDCGLTTLAELPPFPELRSLSLIGNSIKDKEVVHLTKYPRLSKLVLTDNEIESLDVFGALGRLRSLEHL
jgi:Leucine-rich repeat (LRR) protein